MRTFLVFLVAASASNVAGCFRTSSCDGVSVEPPVITVVDSATGKAVCDATIEAVSAGAPPLTLVSHIPPAEAGAMGCHYFPASFGPDGGVNGAAPFPAGTYTLTISRQGFTSATVADVASQMSSCENSPPPAQDVDVVLVPD